MEAKYVGPLGTIAFYADCFADDQAREGQVRELRDAYAAVAELVEAAKAMQHRVNKGGTTPEWAATRAQFDAALAKFGGA